MNANANENVSVIGTGIGLVTEIGTEIMGEIRRATETEIEMIDTADTMMTRGTGRRKIPMKGQNQSLCCQRRRVIDLNRRL